MQIFQIAAFLSALLCYRNVDLPLATLMPAFCKLSACHFTLLCFKTERPDVASVPMVLSMGCLSRTAVSFGVSLANVADEAWDSSICVDHLTIVSLDLLPPEACLAPLFSNSMLTGHSADNANH